MTRILIFITFVLIANFIPNFSLAVEEKLTISDKEIIERLIRLEEGQKALREQMMAGQTSLQGQIDGLGNLILGGFGVIFAGIFALIGFVIWDRRTALSPAITQIEELRRRERNLEETLRKYAASEPKLAEIMKSLGLW